MPGRFSDRERKRLRIQKLLELNWTIAAICEEEKCNRSTVRRWKQRFERGESEQDRGRSGRPLKLSPIQQKQVVNFVEGKAHRSTRKAATWLRFKGANVSRYTVSR